MFERLHHVLDMARRILDPFVRELMAVGALAGLASLRAIAAAASLAPDDLRELIAGQRERPKPETIRRIATALGIAGAAVEDLFRRARRVAVLEGRERPRRRRGKRSSGPHVAVTP